MFYYIVYQFHVTSYILFLLLKKKKTSEEQTEEDPKSNDESMQNQKLNIKKVSRMN